MDSQQAIGVRTTRRGVGGIKKEEVGFMGWLWFVLARKHRKENKGAVLGGSFGPVPGAEG